MFICKRERYHTHIHRAIAVRLNAISLELYTHSEWQRQREREKRTNAHIHQEICHNTMMDSVQIKCNETIEMAHTEKLACIHRTARGTYAFLHPPYSYRRLCRWINCNVISLGGCICMRACQQSTRMKQPTICDRFACDRENAFGKLRMKQNDDHAQQIHKCKNRPSAYTPMRYTEKCSNNDQRKCQKLRESAHCMHVCIPSIRFNLCKSLPTPHQNEIQCHTFIQCHMYITSIGRSKYMYAFVGSLRQPMMLYFINTRKPRPAIFYIYTI